jgi:excisionase family DNA binding protein
MLENLGKPLTVKEVAEALGVPEKWVYRHWGELGGIKLGRHVRFFEKRIMEVVNGLQKNTQGQGAMVGRGKSNGAWPNGQANQNLSLEDRGTEVGTRDQRETSGSKHPADEFGIFS